MSLLVDDSRVQSTAGRFREERQHTSTLVDSLPPTATQSRALQDYILAQMKELPSAVYLPADLSYHSGKSARTFSATEFAFDDLPSLQETIRSANPAHFFAEIFRRPILDEVQQKVLLELENLRNLQPGWDGAAGEKINPQSIEVAKLFVCQMPTDDFLKPDVVPMSRGRLQLEWHNGPFSLELEFESPSQIHYLKWNSAEGTEEEAVVEGPAGWHKADELIQWFILGASDV